MFINFINIINEYDQSIGEDLNRTMFTLKSGDCDLVLTLPTCNNTSGSTQRLFWLLPEITK